MTTDRDPCSEAPLRNPGIQAAPRGIDAGDHLDAGRESERSGRTREVIPGMTDEEVLAHYRDRDFNPYMTLCTARALYALSMKYRHVGLAAAKAQQEALEEQRQQLRALVNATAAARSIPESKPTPPLIALRRRDEPG